MSEEIEQVIDTKNEDGTGTVTVIATDGTSKSERYDSYYSNSQAEAQKGRLKEFKMSNIHQKIEAVSKKQPLLIMKVHYIDKK